MRYRVLDLPVTGAGAFTPGCAVVPLASSWGMVKTNAILGRTPVPVRYPLDASMGNRNSGLGHLQDSNNAPNAILPAQYVAYPTNMGPTSDAGIGMATRRHTPLPVPAASWTRAARQAMAGRKIGGRAAIPWPRSFQRFPTTSGGRG